MHTCTLILLFHQHLDVRWMNHLLTNTELDRFVNNGEWSYVHIKTKFLRYLSSAHKKMGLYFCSVYIAAQKIPSCCAKLNCKAGNLNLYFYSLDQNKVTSLMIILMLEISIHLLNSKPLTKKKSTWKYAVGFRAGMGR